MNMKFALAAGVCAAALAGFSDVQSANVVGYMGKDTPNGGNKMISPMFLNVGSTGTYKLSDLSCGNYSKEDGTAGDFSMSFLGIGGSAAKFTEEDGIPEYVGLTKRFFWFDDEEHEPGWYDSDGYVRWDADKIIFKAGDGFWTLGYTLSLVTSGQVGKSLVTVRTPNGGNTPSGNPFPVAMALSKLYCDGYEPEDGSAGDFSMSILGIGGSAEKFTEADGIPEYIGMTKRFFWFEDEEHEAGWYDSDGNFHWDAEKINLKPGEGLWLLGYGLNLNFPVPESIQNN